MNSDAFVPVWRGARRHHYVPVVLGHGACYGFFRRVPRLAGRSSQESRSPAKAWSIAGVDNDVVADGEAVPWAALAKRRVREEVCGRCELGPTHLRFRLAERCAPNVGERSLRGGRRVVGSRRRDRRRRFWYQMRHRGPLLIHAAKRWTADLAELLEQEPFRSALAGLGIRDEAGLPFGAIVGQVEVVACYRTEDVRCLAVNPPEPFEARQDGRPVLTIEPIERALGDYSPGRFACLCGNARVLEQPIPWTGQRSVFEVDANGLCPTAISSR